MMDELIKKIKDRLDGYDEKTFILPYDPANFQGRRQSPESKTETETKTVRVDTINMTDQDGHPVKAESISPNINFILKCYNYGQGMSDSDEGQIDSFIIPLIEGLETPIKNKIDSLAYLTGVFFCLLGSKNPNNDLFDLMWGVEGEPDKFRTNIISLILFEAAQLYKYPNNGEEKNEETNEETNEEKDKGTGE